MSGAQETAANELLDAIITHYSLKNDAALCRLLEVAPPIVSKVRHQRIGLSDDLILRIHERTGMPVREIKTRLGRKVLDLSDAAPMAA